MTQSTTSKWRAFLRGPVALTVVALLLAVLGRGVLPWKTMFPDFVCYWASGKIVASGESLYDFRLQTQYRGSTRSSNPGHVSGRQLSLEAAWVLSSIPYC